jgi:hypothetical protein
MTRRKEPSLLERLDLIRMIIISIIVLAVGINLIAWMVALVAVGSNNPTAMEYVEVAASVSGGTAAAIVIGGMFVSLGSD